MSKNALLLNSVQFFIFLCLSFSFEWLEMGTW